MSDDFDDREPELDGAVAPLGGDEDPDPLEGDLPLEENELDGFTTDDEELEKDF